jgi:flagellar biosynthesis protein FlhG
MAASAVSHNLKKPRSIWAVGGGKGGSGKSLLAASLGIYLAQMGNKTILVDVDLGGANLHTWLGLRSPRTSVTNFIAKSSPRLDDLLLDTPVDGLKFLSASWDSFELANLGFLQKERLIRHIKTLPAEIIILDIGAGSSFNVLDFFLCADMGIIIALPEPTSVENAYRFLKSAIFRKLSRTVENRGLRETIRATLRQTIRHDLRTIRDFIEHLRPYNGSVADQLEEVLKGFHPLLVINQTRRDEDLKLGPSMEDIAGKYLGIRLRYLGAIPYDERVHYSIKDLRPLMLAYPASPAALSIAKIAERLICLKEVPSGVELSSRQGKAP